MVTILLHSSKTMKKANEPKTYQKPQLLDKAIELDAYLKSLKPSEISSVMQLSPAMAGKTHALLQNWTAYPADQSPAIDTFLGDIYSGLQADNLTDTDRAYANDHLLILSGLYGGLRALDSISPYRLEMGYRLPDDRYKNLYSYWGNSIAELIPDDHPVINLSAVEYTKVVLPYLANSEIITPKFLTLDSKTKEPKFVVVHAKIARGAFARWLIVNKIHELQHIKHFADLGYLYDESLSSIHEPVFTCQEFAGLGLSVRLKK